MFYFLGRDSDLCVKCMDGLAGEWEGLGNALIVFGEGVRNFVSIGI